MVMEMGISLGVLLAGSLAVVCFRARRTAAGKPATDATRRRAVLEDCGDDVIWEVGRLRPVVATQEFEEHLSKRSFLRRATFSVAAFGVAWLASRGQSVALGAAPRPAGGRLSGKHPPMPEDGQHVDEGAHTDFGDSSAHLDSPGSHSDW